MKCAVVMPLIPGGVKRGDATSRTGVQYAKYSKVSWVLWCDRHNVSFVVLDSPCTDDTFKDLSPTYQRWMQALELLKKYDRILLIDADTIVKWDAPNFFTQVPYGSFAGVIDPSIEWLPRSLHYYSPVFPGVTVPVDEYFNCGMIMLDRTHIPFLEFVRDLVTQRKPYLLQVQLQSGYDVGSDQTPMNYMRRVFGLPLCVLPPAYNLVYCFGHIPHGPEYNDVQIEHMLHFVFNQAPEGELYGFQKDGYVWHFNSSLPYRLRLMQEAWRRVSSHYI